MVVHITGFEDILDLVVRGLHKLEIQLQPLFNELRLLLCSDEVVLVGEMPVNFSVDFLVDLPIERRAVVWMPEHEYFGNLAIPIKNILTGIASYIE